ncbi:MAG: MarR family winged helix-turn-helix transcriptional regulator [Granulosicoccus sp.]|nr:MarR family winged helix-turn-helix transcriptional regulator [Granulosicoccus sp.]
MPDRIPQFHPILHAANLISEKLREDLADFGGTSTQGRVLDVIDRLENPVPARVGEALGLTASAMSQMVGRLRSAQLIEPSQRKEGRAYSEHLVLSEGGADFLQHTRQAWDEIEQELIDLIGEEALETMFHTSFDIVQGLGANPPFPRHLHLARDQEEPPESTNAEMTKRSK